jgi:hypothetical protein
MLPIFTDIITKMGLRSWGVDMEELIRKKDALDALMAEREHLLANGQKGAEHVLIHHGYNVIDELPPVQSDVPVINVGDMISKQAAIDAIFSEPLYESGMKKRDADEVVPAIYEKIKAMPPAQPEPRQRHGMWILEVSPFGKVYVKCSECGEYALNDTEGEQVKSKCCPSCGIKMLRGEADDK